MDLNKITDAYCYLNVKRSNFTKEFILKVLWAADCESLWHIGRTVTGCDIPITELPDNMPYHECRGCGLFHRTLETERDFGPFGDLSLYDMQRIDSAYLDNCGEPINTDIYKYKSLEEFFRGHDFAEEMISEVRENQMMKKDFNLIFK